MEAWGGGREEEGLVGNGASTVVVGLCNGTATAEKLGSYSKADALLASAKGQSACSEAMSQ